MTATLFDELRRLQAEGEWSELRMVAEQALAVVSDASDVARAHLFVSVAVFQTAQTADDWRLSLDHARQALDCAPADSLLRLVALQKCASLSTDMGKRSDAARYAHDYLREAPRLGSTLDAYTPYVLRDLALVQKSAYSAIAYARQALRRFETLGTSDEIARTATQLAWFYAVAGRTEDAKSVLPASMPESIDYLRNGVLCLVAHREGRYNEAKEYGRLALRAERRHFDYCDAAKICLILADIAYQERKTFDVVSYLVDAYKFAARQANRSVFALQTPEIMGAEEVKRSEHEACRVCVPCVRLAAGSVFTTGLA